jgi:hypothetical protein
MWLIDMVAKLLTQTAEPDPNGTYRHPKIAVIASEAKQSFWPGINHLEIAASLALLAMTSDFSSSKCYSDLTPISF